VTSTFSDSFETLLDAYEQIGIRLPFFRQYEKLFHENLYMVQVLELIYIDILDFHQEVIRILRVKGKGLNTSEFSIWHRTDNVQTSLEEALQELLEGLRRQIRWPFAESQQTQGIYQGSGKRT
jgi:hypothetical protein